VSAEAVSISFQLIWICMDSLIIMGPIHDIEHYSPQGHVVASLLRAVPTQYTS
jgi:hypothetical protein